MDVSCKRCGVPIPADDINLEHLVAKCRRCNAVFDLTAQLEASRGEVSGIDVARSQRPQRHEVAMPEGFRVVRGPNGGFFGVGYGNGAQCPRSSVTLVRRWFNPVADLALLFFAVVWNAFLVFWYSAVLLMPNVPWIMVVFPIGHVAVGIGIGYRALAGLINRTTIAVTSEALSVRHGPLPWAGNRTLDANQVTQLYCMDKVTNTKNGTRTTWEVHANLANGSSLALVSGLTALNQALYIEQEVERALAIEDVRIPGEVQY